MVEKETVAAYETGYIKLYKNSRGYNWEIKVFKGMTKEDMIKIMEDVKAVNAELEGFYGVE